MFRHTLELEQELERLKAEATAATQAEDSRTEAKQFRLKRITAARRLSDKKFICRKSQDKACLC